MTTIRFNSIESIMQRPNPNGKEATAAEQDQLGGRISEYFGENVFNEDAMRKYLSEEAYLSVKASIDRGEKIERSIADQVAASIKAWALDKGATHFTHWFQPLTGATAEKHDTFFSAFPGQQAGMENFSGDALVQQEPDASSFPHGGIRSTFEARGYTAWDPSSPAFIMEIGRGKTLCIPTIFVSYTGEALDYKAPLLKSAAFLDQAAVDVCQYFDRKVNRVHATLGWEQEYFVVDEALFYARPDLVMAGRTVQGHAPARGQQLDDHYFGSIPERVYAYMLDFEREALRLGIPVKTRHNEVAPGQYECAPTFEDVNLAVDHNQLLMDLMDRVAKRHKLCVLLHEKPFAEINGSGKHNNWSMSTDTGKNLLSPGKTPKNNLMFLTFFVNVIKAVSEHSDILRASIASAGNDHRLGANEAPPAIFSVFIGDQLTAVLNEVENKVKEGAFDDIDKDELKISIHKIIPDVLKDNTDRNRTSPFAFTGNKFEIRAVGSSTNCASPMTVMNTIMAQQLVTFKKEVDELIKKKKKNKDNAILQVLRNYIKESRNILFEGDNYSADWEKEAEKRGLSNEKTTPHALDFLVDKRAKALFTKNGILNENEMAARHEIQLENYLLKVGIEASIMRDISLNQVIPAAIEYQKSLTETVVGLKSAGLAKPAYKGQMELLEELSTHINGLKAKINDMVKEIEKAEKAKSTRDQAIAYCDKVKVKMDEARVHADRLEVLVEDALWPLPKYRELLFIR